MGLHSRAAEDVEYTIERARTAERPDLPELRAWCFHPDERVPLALVANDDREWLERYHWYIPVALWVRGIRINREEDLAWNPILDSIPFMSRHRPSPGSERLRKWEELEGDRFGTESQWALDLDQTLLRVEEEVGQHGLPLVEYLADFRTRPIVQAAIKHAPSVSQRLMAKARQRPDLLRAFANRGDLPPSQVEQVTRSILDLLKRFAGGGLDAQEAIAALFTNHLAREGKNDASRGERAAGAGRRVIDDMLDAMAEHGDDTSKRHSLFSALLTVVPWMSAGQMEAMYERFGEQQWVVLRLIKHATGPETLPLLRRVIEEHKSTQMRLTLAQNALALADPHICDGVSRSRAQDVESNILSHGRGPGLNRVVRRQLRSDDAIHAIKSLERRWHQIHGDVDEKVLAGAPDTRAGSTARSLLVRKRLLEAEGDEQLAAALDDLATFGRAADLDFYLEHAPEQVARLGPEQMAPLLTSKDRALRMHAMMVLAELREKDAPGRTPAGDASHVR